MEDDSNSEGFYTARENSIEEVHITAHSQSGVSEPSMESLEPALPIWDPTPQHHNQTHPILNPKLLQAVSIESSRQWVAAFAPSGDFLATASLEGQILIFEVTRRLCGGDCIVESVDVVGAVGHEAPEEPGLVPNGSPMFDHRTIERGQRFELSHQRVRGRQRVAATDGGVEGGALQCLDGQQALGPGPSVAAGDAVDGLQGREGIDQSLDAS